MNLYHCIENFYKNTDGYVTDLSFTTSRGVHHEKLKANAIDIRKADYHIGGKKEEGYIYPYKSNKKFDVNTKLNGNYQIEIFAGVTHHYFNARGTKFLKYVKILGVKDFDGYRKTIQNIVKNS